jgi:branched-chain amino acid transport system permease protein
LLQTLIQTVTDGIAVGSLYALIALGYTLVFGILQFINFAHGDVFALGAWLTLTIATHFNPSLAGVNAGWFHTLVYIASVPLLAIMICGMVGFCIERFAYRPLRSAPRLNVLITAIGVSLLMENVGQLNTRWTFGTQPQPVPVLIQTGLPVMGSGGVLVDPSAWYISGVPIPRVDQIVFFTAVLLMIGLQLLIFKTRFGTAMRAVSFNAKAAALMGINVDRIISITFIIGSALAGAAGYLYALKYQQQTLQQTAASMWVLLGMKAFVAAVVGGIGNVRGAMLGGLLIGLVEHFGAAAGDLGNQIGLWHASINTSQYKDVYVFLLLILVLLIRPAGLLGRATVEKV